VMAQPIPPQQLLTPMGQPLPFTGFTPISDSTAFLDAQQKALIQGRPPDPQQPLAPLPTPQSFGAIATPVTPTLINPLPAPSQQNPSVFSTTGVGTNTFARTMSAGPSDRQRFRQEVDRHVP
ncbi:MAG: hypothetical protein FD167_6181, partial [bacterium]